jgi:hypothetical protein
MTPSNIFTFVRFQVLTAVSMNIKGLWDMAPCSLIALTMEAVRTSETSFYFKEATRLYIPEV